MRTAGIALTCLLASCARTSQSAPGPEETHRSASGAASAHGATEREDVATHRTPERKRMTISVGGSAFVATLFDTEAAAAFEAMLPLTLDMTDLNANEKLHDLPRELPGDPMNPGTLHAGDLMLYGSNTLVLFYETFPTTYRYTRIARIEDPRGLAAAVGAGDVKVAFTR